MKNCTKKRSRGVRVILFILLIAIVFGVVFVGYQSYLAFAPQNAVAFDGNKLTYINQNVSIYDANNSVVDERLGFNNNKYIPLSQLPDYVSQFFVIVEDKRFFTHNGVDYKRIAGALLNNLTGGATQGASTISQQLIKNTHLNSEKTLKRKLQESKLAYELEHNYTKTQILEMYLNTIYYGNQAYGIEAAANTYFNESAQNITQAEAAMLAAIIRAPSIYSPNINLEKCLNRRNMILSLAHDQNIIDDNSYQDAINTVIDLSVINDANSTAKNYCDGVIAEACHLLNVDESQLLSSNLKIYTYMDSVLQDKIAAQAQKPLHNPINSKGIVADNAIVMIDNTSSGICAFYGNSKQNLYTMRRQPASCIKPILVYAPALEHNLISPATPVLDEKTSFNGYAPSNFNNKYYGWITVRDAVRMSLNTPATKILNSLGVENAKKMAMQNGIVFDNNDTDLALSLGGFTYGTTIFELANSYTTFANGGMHKNARFIRAIVDEKGNKLYKHETKSKRVMRSDTAFLMTDMLRDCKNNGTAKLMKDLNYDLAVKTGTVASSRNSQLNTDAWLMAYSTRHTLGVWYGSGSEDGLLEHEIVGGTSPVILARSIFLDVYGHQSPDEFEPPSSVKKIDIDALSLNNQKIEIACENTPDKYKSSQYFSVYNMPIERSVRFASPTSPHISVSISGGKCGVTVDANPEYCYKIYRVEQDKETLIYDLKHKQGKIEIIDDYAKQGKTYSYFAVAYLPKTSERSEILGDKSNMVTAVIPLDLVPDQKPYEFDFEDYFNTFWW